jgi:hypothetical protein
MDKTSQLEIPSHPCDGMLNPMTVLDPRMLTRSSAKIWYSRAPVKQQNRSVRM